ncbi:hypothetical protein C7999DRAFT_10403 [Corynascus novoguineensis]|uniref:Uncharacterized protein n=1 Tax=Corynascus novoguineensis TaxID=1126955 RepID=A0AAN7D1I4_9PEZI|nr:hypothetical protein C7999DRAFT_10403 [Corynascus novoguineensis]
MASQKQMPSPTKRRPPLGAGPKGSNASGPRSPPRSSRTSPSTVRKVNTGTSSSSSSSSSTFIAPPPRAALSGRSSPAPDHPPADNNSSNTPRDSPHVAPTIASRNRSPSPSTAPPPISHQQPATTSTPFTSSSSSSSMTMTAGAAAGSAAAITTALATCQSALRERETRIASLERELALMETEFHRELDRLSGAESATAAFWQGKYAALEKTVEGVLALQQHQQHQPLSGQKGQEGSSGGAGAGSRRGRREANWEGERDRIRDQNLDILEKEGELREVRAAWERARDMLDKKEDEVAQLKAQVRGLKEWVSHSTRADGEAQTSDEVFGDAMARLGNGLQNWVLVNFRRARIGECHGLTTCGLGGWRLTVTDLSGAHEDAISELSRLVPMYEELVSTSKIHLLQSVVSRLLVELVFDAYFVGLPDEVAGQIKQVEAFLSSTSSPESINQWRSLTLTMLKRDASERVQAETLKVVNAVVSKVNKILDSITNTASTEARDQGLQALLNSAIELSRLIAVQKAVFRIEMPEILPHQRVMFDSETMEDIGGEDEDSLADREISCVTFPGIVKRGDESGGHLQYRNVICKAKVLCSPE